MTARGEHAGFSVRLAEDGADIIAIDLCGPVDVVDMYPPATRDDLDLTVRLVEGTGRRIVAAVADVRDVEGTRTDLDPRLAALSIIGATNWVYRWFRPGDDLTPEQIRGIAAS